MLFFSKWSGKQKVSTDLLSFMQTDIHSHLLPGVDDGSKDSDTTIQFIEQLQEMGIQRIITTPHVMMDRYPNAANTLQPSYDAVSRILSNSGNQIPFRFAAEYYLDEQFAPLLGLDMTFTNQLSLKFDYTKQRQLSLSLIDYQLSEVNSSQVTFGGSFRKKGMKLPFKVPFSKTGSKTLDNEINFSLNFSIRNNVTSNSILDQNSSFATSGSKQISISPTLSYYINNRINVQLYFTQDRVIPYISSSAPTTNTRAGVQLRISLAPPPSNNSKPKQK